MSQRGISLLMGMLFFSKASLAHEDLQIVDHHNKPRMSLPFQKLPTNGKNKENTSVYLPKVPESMQIFERKITFMEYLESLEFSSSSPLKDMDRQSRKS